MTAETPKKALETLNPFSPAKTAPTPHTPRAGIATPARSSADATTHPNPTPVQSTPEQKKLSSKEKAKIIIRHLMSLNEIRGSEITHIAMIRTTQRMLERLLEEEKRPSTGLDSILPYKEKEKKEKCEKLNSHLQLYKKVSRRDTHLANDNLRATFDELPVPIFDANNEDEVSLILKPMEETLMSGIEGRLKWLEETDFETYITGIRNFNELQNLLTSSLEPTSKVYSLVTAEITNGLTWQSNTISFVQRLPRYVLFLNDWEKWLKDLFTPFENLPAAEQTKINAQLEKINTLRRKFLIVTAVQILLDPVTNTDTDRSKLTPDILFEASKIALQQRILELKAKLMKSPTLAAAKKAVSAEAKMDAKDNMALVHVEINDQVALPLKDLNQLSRDLEGCKNSIEMIEQVKKIEDSPRLPITLRDEVRTIFLDIIIQAIKLQSPSALQQEINALCQRIKEITPFHPLLYKCLNCLNNQLAISELEKAIAKLTQVPTAIEALINDTIAVQKKIIEPKALLEADTKKSTTEESKTASAIPSATKTGAILAALSAPKEGGHSDRRATIINSASAVCVLPNVVGSTRGRKSTISTLALSAEQLALQESFIKALLSHPQLASADMLEKAQEMMQDVLAQNPDFKNLTPDWSTFTLRVKAANPQPKDIFKAIANLRKAYENIKTPSPLPTENVMMPRVSAGIAGRLSIFSGASMVSPTKKANTPASPTPLPTPTLPSLPLPSARRPSGSESNSATPVKVPAKQIGPQLPSAPATPGATI